MSATLLLPIAAGAGFAVSAPEGYAEGYSAEPALVLAAMKEAAAAAQEKAAAAPANDDQFDNEGGFSVKRLPLKPIFDVRYRLEHVDQEGFDRNAVANTLSTRFGFKLEASENVEFLVEAEGVANLNGQFNSTTNGATQFPIVADPDEIELNRAQVTLKNIVPNTEITVGRQKIAHDDQRFVGAVAFRQNMQTFDAVRLKTKPVKGLTVDYAYIDRVHRIFGDGNPNGNFNSRSHIAEASYKAGKFGTIAAYTYLLDFEQAAMLSSSTVGVRMVNEVPLGDKLRLQYKGAYARQWDYGDNPMDYAVSYGKAEAAVSLQPVAIRATYERLGSDGVNSFKTPLATLHKFQGYADVFLATPAAGIEDRRIAAEFKKKDLGPFAVVKASVAYHDFSAAQGSADLGEELDAVITAKIGKHVTTELKGGKYYGPAGGPASRDRFWFMLKYQL